MSKADDHRSTPGYVYDVGMSSSRQEEGTPSCACPCHLANTPSGAKGWYCNRCYGFIVCGSWPEKPPLDYSHEQAIEDGTTNPRPCMVSVPNYYFITKGNTLDDELEEHFSSEEEADARAEELNRADVLASLNLDPAFAKRRQRLQRLGETFWVRYGEGHSETRWPEKPGRYAVKSYSDRYSESFWETVDTLDEVEAEVLRGDVDEIVDLDGGAEVPFKLSVSIGQS